MFVIMIYTTLILHVPDGPAMRQLDGGADTCQQYWWTNLLYINNFVPDNGDLSKQVILKTLVQLLC